MEDMLKDIKGINKDFYKMARDKMDGLIKPLKSLGALEDMACRICGIEEKFNIDLSKRIVVVMCSDNGVYEEGVASAPQSVTAMQTINFLRGITGISVISKKNNCDLEVVDMGVREHIEFEGLNVQKIRCSTSNIAKGPAMTIDECNHAIHIGINIVKRLKEEGYKLIGTGEMGIANTTTSSAMLVALTGCSIEDATGYGAGLTEKGYELKKKVIEKSLSVNIEENLSPIEILRRLGGFDIAGMVGMYLGAAYYRVPIVIDGFISAVAALCAYKINPSVVDFMFPSHVSVEKGYNIAIDMLKLKPILNLDMRLGEGVGCPIAFNIMDTAVTVLNEMGTFEEGNVNIGDYKSLWREEN